MDQDWTEGAWLNGNPILEPLENYDYIWIFVRGDKLVKGDNKYWVLIPYGDIHRVKPDFFLATQYYAYHHNLDAPDRQELRWWWKPLSSPAIPKG